MSFLIFILFICCQADRHISIILLSAPKKVPMLEYTLDYFLNAYQFNHEGFVIDSFYLAKGTEGPYPLIFDEAEKLKKAGINAFVKEGPYEFMGEENLNKAHEFISRWWNDFQSHQYTYQHYKITIKDNLINYYFMEAYKLMKARQGYPEYLLFLEDDVAIKKTFFVELRKIMDNYNDPREITKKISIRKNQNIIPEYEYQRNRTSCNSGFFGIFLDERQQRIFEKLYHFFPFGMCIDFYHCVLSKIYNYKIFNRELMVHFGHDKNIKPRMKKYWD